MKYITLFILLFNFTFADVNIFSKNDLLNEFQIKNQGYENKINKIFHSLFPFL